MYSICCVRIQNFLGLLHVSHPVHICVVFLIASIFLTSHASGSADLAANEDLASAIRTGSVELVTRLIEQGRNVNTPDANGVTPLGTAAMYGQLEIATILIKKGANANSGKYPPLTCAAGMNRTDQIDIVNLLLENGANIDKARYDGLTPLQLAVMHGHYDIVKLLLQKGANSTIVTPEGHTVLDWAVLLKRSDVEELLKSQGATPGCGPYLGKKTVTNDLTVFSLFAFLPAAFLIFLLATYFRHRNSLAISPIVLAYSIPITVFFALQIPYLCSTTVQRTLFGAVPAVSSLTLQALAIFLKRPSLLKFARAFAIFGLLLLAPFYVFVLIMMLSGTSS